MISLNTERVMLKCSQTGDRFCAKISNLSTEDGQSVLQSDILPGKNVMVDVSGSTYPAEVIGMEGYLLREL